MTNLTEIRKLRELRAQKNEEAQQYRTKPGDTPEQVNEKRVKFDKIMDEADDLKAKIDEMESDAKRQARAEELERETRGTGRREDPIGGGAKGERSTKVLQYKRALKRYGTKALQNVASDVRQEIEDMNAQYFEALRNYGVAVGKGDAAACSDEDREIVFGKNEDFRTLCAPGTETRDMGISTNSLGGFFVPQGYVYEIIEAMKYYGPMLEVADVMDTATGQLLPWPTDNDTTVVGELVGEGKQVSEADVSIGRVTFSAFKFSSKSIKISIELLQDSAFDMESYLRKKMATRLGRILNTKFTTGAGTTEPLGIVTAVVANNAAANTVPAYGQGLIAAGSGANTGGAETGATSIGTSDLNNLEHSVDPLYRRNARYMFHDQTLRFAKNLLDKYGRPLWKPGVAVGSPDTINGYPYAINNDMDQIATGKKTVLFGDTKMFVVRRVMELGITVLRERFADYGVVGFIGFARYDSNLLDAGTHPLTYLQQA